MPHFDHVEAVGVALSGSGWDAIRRLSEGDRPDYDQPDTAGGTAAQHATAAAGYLAYSGPYAVDEEATGIVHH